jgi:phospholipase C
MGAEGIFRAVLSCGRPLAARPRAPDVESGRRVRISPSAAILSVKANKNLWAETAIFVTFDEGGGYWDSGYVQPLDFFGDGTRIPMIVVSPFSTGGHISHTYTDHVSTLKFIERNRSLRPLSKRSRDNLPNPVTEANPYVPVNSPAIGDLTDMFDFDR